MPAQGWRKRVIGTYDGRPVVGAECPWCHDWYAMCRYYCGAWRADSYMVQVHSFTCPKRPRRERRREWRPGRRRGPNVDHVLRITYEQVNPDTPRNELPDELPVNLAAGLAKCDPSRIRQLCRGGALDARKGEVYGSVGWLVETDSLLAWMVATGRRRAGA